MMKSKLIRTISYHSGNWDAGELQVIGEQAVTLTVNNEPWLSFMCTPLDLEALAIGFLYNEEVIQSADEIASVRVCPGEENIDVWLDRAVKMPEKWTRTSGCSGGKTSVRRPPSETKKISTNGGCLPGERVGYLIAQLSQAQELYRASGGVHTSALSDGEKILVVAEDIGRHNTLDKIAGHCLTERLSSGMKIILTTGRISSEMLQKTGRIGASIVISRTSPTSLSVQMAEALGITLVGYARPDRFIVYTHPHRILQAERLLVHRES